ncbi:uncharacterized protein LOC134827316 [Culicoides brevitarsis]|uniref:uncharacterized protein LOC134827316 n=1 Tax=Culicoides brevitarsis TaxID=469753 RepID=UPI00307BD1D1
MSLIITDSYSKSFEDATSIYDFSAHDATGSLVNFKEMYFNKVCLIVNVTVKGKDAVTLLKKLNKIRSSFSKKDFAILVFPCFQFGASDTVKGLVNFLKENSLENMFDVFNEVQVNGPDASEMYKYLKIKQRGFMGGIINKNFTMFLTNKNGEPVQRLMPTVPADIIIKEIRGLI